MKVKLHVGDCIDKMRELSDNSVDSVVTDPPYELGFMGKSWDSTGIAYSVRMWDEVLRVLKPGGHLIAFSGSRTYHRMAVAIEDAGFEIRDQIMWVYGSGFPKSLNLSKAIEATVLNGSSHSTALRKTEQDGGGESYQLVGKNNGILGETRVYDRKQFSPSTTEARNWEGWGTALKPAHEPIVLARKPSAEKTVAKNVLEYGTGALNIEGSRIGDGTGKTKTVNYPDIRGNNYNNASGTVEYTVTDQGRWPANFIHDGSDEVTELLGDSARFFYCPKTSKKDRNEGLDGFEEKRPDERTETGMGTFTEKGVAKQANHHPTVKPTELMRYLVRMITPPNGTVMDPFMGSGSTGKAAILERFNFIGIDQSEEYVEIAAARIKSAQEKLDGTLL
jgi:site-specific DNA-methyltransferase (adenine-specific)